MRPVGAGWLSRGPGIVRGRVVSGVVVIGLGVVLGLVGPVAGKFDNGVCEALSVVFSGGWPWACFAFLVGISRTSKGEAALLASFGLAAGVVAYYLFKDAYPARGGVGGGVSTMVLTWGVAAFLFGAPVGVVGSLARTPGIGGLFFRLLVPVIAWFETSQRLRMEAEGQGGVVWGTWAVVRVGACLVAALLVGHTAWGWWRGRSGRADASARGL